MAPQEVSTSRAERTARRVARSLGVALALLVLLDVVLRSPLYPAGFPEDFRIPKDTLMGYDSFTEWIAQQDGVRVAMLGDSVVEGHISKRGQTLPARLDDVYDRDDRDVHVYNLALRGAHSNDLFAVAADLSSAGAVDLLVVQFNYIYYGNDERFTEHYPELFAGIEDLSPYSRAELESLGTSFEEPAEPGPLERAVEATWRLYRERDHIDAVAFGGRPALAVERAVLDFGRAAADQPGARRFEPGELDPDNLERYFGSGLFANDNPHVRFLGMLVRKAVMDGVPVVVFNNPLYFEGLEYWDALDRSIYDENVAAVRMLVESNGGMWVDLAEDFPQEYMLDTVHLLPEGAEFAAERLAEEVEPVVATLERKAGERR